MFNGRRQPSRDGTSRMTREYQVRFCERLGVKFPGPTRQPTTIPAKDRFGPVFPRPDISSATPEASRSRHFRTFTRRDEPQSTALPREQPTLGFFRTTLRKYLIHCIRDAGPKLRTLDFAHTCVVLGTLTHDSKRIRIEFGYRCARDRQDVRITFHGSEFSPRFQYSRKANYAREMDESSKKITPERSKPAHATTDGGRPHGSEATVDIYRSLTPAISAIRMRSAKFLAPILRAICA